MVHEQPQSYYENLYKNEKKYQAHYKDSIYYPIWALLLGYLRTLPSPHILEIGCGSGQLAHYLFDEGFRNYHGFDFCEEAISLAKKRVNQSFAVGNALEPVQFSYDYNVVIATEVLEHVEQDRAILTNIRPGTPIVITLPRFWDPGHVRYFTKHKQIKRRYFKHIDISRIYTIEYWYAVFGTVDPFHANCIHRLFGKRKIRF